MATKSMVSAKSTDEAVPVRITDRQVEQAVERAINNAVDTLKVFEMYDQMLANTPAGQRTQLIDTLYRMLSYSLSEENLNEFPSPGSEEEDTFRLSQLGLSAREEFRQWANQMRRELRDPLSSILCDAINRVKSGTGMASVEFSMSSLSEEQRQFAYMVFDSFTTSQSLQPPSDYVRGQYYTGTKRNYSSEDAASRQIPAWIEYGGTQVTVMWPPWLYGQGRTEYNFQQ